MLGKLWRWLKRWLQRWRKSPRPETARPQPAAPVRPAVTRPDVEYEALFLSLLDQLQPDWGYGQIQGWLLAHALKPTELTAWLERFGQRLLDSSEPNLPLAERLVQFSQIDRSELGRVAGEMGQELLRQNAAVNQIENETVAVDENVVAQAQAFFNQGLEKAMAGDFEGAIALWDKAIEYKPDYHEAWNNRGVALSALGRHEEAISSYDKALEFKPDYHEAWYNRGNALSKLGRKEEAISSYEKALEFKPNKYEAWNNRGFALSALGRKEEALSSYDKALEYKPDYHEAWYNRGVVLSNLGRKEKAIDNYREGLRYVHRDVNPGGWGSLHWGMGRVYYFWERSASPADFYFSQTLSCYHTALQTLTPEAFPEWHLKVIQDMIRAYLGLGNQTEANHWREQGLKVYRELINRATPARR